MSNHRVKRKDLITALFVLFSSEYDRQMHESILEIAIPVSSIKQYIEERFDVSYSGFKWIYTQIKNYEEDIGYVLFDRILKDDREYYLRIHHTIEAFTQKRHMYITQKIKVSNALYDMISHQCEAKKEAPSVVPCTTLLIDAGSSVLHLADIIAKQSAEHTIRYTIHTHNISVIKRMLEPHVDHDYISLECPRGIIDPITNSILGENMALYRNTTYDMVIQGTSILYNGRVAVEQESESTIKHELLHEVAGSKILILTGHEVRTEQPSKTYWYFGDLKDFDYLIVPYNSEGRSKNLNTMLLEMGQILEPHILNWNYRIYRIRQN